MSDSHLAIEIRMVRDGIPVETTVTIDADVVTPAFVRAATDRAVENLLHGLNRIDQLTANQRAMRRCELRLRGDRHD